MKTVRFLNSGWCIATDFSENDIVYLCWQQPAWEDDGYFWTSIDSLLKCICNNTATHPFVFTSRKEAINHIKRLNLTQRCRVVRINLHEE